MLHFCEPPSADPHARWCGGWGLNAPGYPISASPEMNAWHGESSLLHEPYIKARNDVGALATKFDDAREGLDAGRFPFVIHDPEVTSPGKP